MSKAIADWRRFLTGRYAAFRTLAVSDAIAVHNDGGLRFKRPLWADNVITTVEVTTPTKVATVRTTEFDAPAEGAAAQCAGKISLQRAKGRCCGGEAFRCCCRPDAFLAR